ncbi:pirin family protein [Acidithiobacillus thiooxidans]|uniref:Quercetin 2,3-dioxygenase n=1 Tax=Acidithiobacillus thiooxidans TaxID=930 RepID=A0A1C2I277_ACITH|nr:pirin family protein [Acidithiobacillus thiooxidans]MBU2812392.1 pirin family protein [Acidithiobacillus thiooxidans]OCX70131.1 quercetin 2,3-dioxygenase [Acidithiobacillus thiooxidans]OCX76415.1 quercetin 2,3-dioxygenase [Acidithiobacillus thiooxidans]OCX81886.1 quercetin 2,3-dioxygenase [Acidithiobacillus thiooxidans]OCX88506.1 quercetin 2,3-dioxygenase [Acidithiobacillus thiooxidans]
MKKILDIYDAPPSHWVGDGFPVSSLLSYHQHGKMLSPFLLLDHAGPMHFTPSKQPRGVGTHPHRGFETVTIVYKGEVAHKDSTGRGGIIGPGDVQWMTAGSGILHEEFHSPAFTAAGGELEMVQLWVNLPARNKMTTPAYQAIVDEDIPQVSLPEQAGSLRVIAGEYAGEKGPAHTFSPLQVWDIRLQAGGRSQWTLPEGWNVALVLLQGELTVNGENVLRAAQMLVLDAAAQEFSIEAHSDAVLLLLSGEPLDEPIVGYGPFVMNTEAEIQQAIADFRSGRFGQMEQ